MTIGDFIRDVDRVVTAGGVPPGIASYIAEDSGSWRRGPASAELRQYQPGKALLVLKREPGGPFGFMSTPLIVELDQERVNNVAGAVTHHLGFYGQ